MPFHPSTVRLATPGQVERAGAELSRAFVSIQPHFVERSLTGAGAARAADAWSLSAVGHL